MSLIVSTSDDLKFHRCPDGVLFQKYRPVCAEKGPVKSVSWSRDGFWVVLVPNSGATEVISIKEALKILQTIQDVPDPTCAAFQNTTKRKIVVGTLTGEVLIYDIKTKNITKRFARASSAVFNVKCNSRDTHLVTACRNGEIILQNMSDTDLSSCSYRIPRSSTVSTINFHGLQGNILSAGSDEGVVATWDIYSNTILCDVQAHRAPVTSLAFSSSNTEILVTAGLDRLFSFQDFRSGKRVAQIEVEVSKTSLDFSCCGNYLAVGSQNGTVDFYDTRSFKNPLETFLAHEEKRVQNLFFQKVQQRNSNQELSLFEVMAKNSPPPWKNWEEGVLREGKMALGLHKNNSDNQDVSNKLPDLLVQKSPMSVPLFLVEKFPMLTDSSTVPESSLDFTESFKQLRDDVTKCVKDELRNQMETLKDFITVELTEMRRDMRHYVMDLEIATVKDFVNMEEKINGIKNCMIKRCNCDDFLINHNNQLIKDVEKQKERK